MQESLINFIKSGTIGDLNLGQSRSEIVAKVGKPEDWLGKPPCFGPIVNDSSQARVWFYYGGAAGIGFDEIGLTESVHILPAKIHGQIPFHDWPITALVTMGKFRNYLAKNKIPFDEELDPDETHYILADKRCVAICLYYDKGRSFSIDDRPVVMIETVLKDSQLPGFVRRKKER